MRFINKNKFTIANIVCITILAIIAYRLTNTINNYWDIIAADELSYLKFGKNLFVAVRFDWGFLYNLWYKFLSLFVYNSVDLYYFNYKVLITIVPIFLFVCLVAYNVNSIIAFLLAYLYLISKLHITTWPFVSDFCIILMLLCLIVIRYINDNGWKAIILTLFSMLLYLARPEYLIAFIIASCLSIYYNTKRKKRLLLLLPMVFLLVYIGSRTTNVSGVDRGFFAYAQHYIITYKIWNRNESIDIYQYIDKLPNIFGKSFTFIGSVFYNPVEAGRHIITCTGYYILTLIKSTEDFFLPSIWLQPVGKIKHILFLLIIIAIIVTIRKYNFTNFFKDNKFLFIPILVFFSATAFSNFIIGYNPHYFQLHFILYIVLLSAILFSKKFPKVNSWILLIVCISTTAFIPPIGRYSFQHVDFLESKHLPIQQLAGILNNLNDGNKHTLLAAQTNLHFIVEGNNFNGLDCFAVSMPFTTFINENKVDFIYVNEQMLNDNKLNKDTEWKLFISHPESHGFIKTSIGNSNNYLLIKNK